MNIKVTENPSEEDNEFVINKNRQYNGQFVENEIRLISAILEILKMRS